MSSSDGIRMVQPHGDTWSVLVPGARRASSTHRERYDAVAVARRTLQNNGGGVVEVYDHSGRISEQHVVAPVRNRRIGELRLR